MNLKNIQETPIIPEEAFQVEGNNSPVFAYPTIKVDEKVKLLENYKKGRENIIGKTLTVKELYTKDLGDMTVYIVKFKETDNYPYLGHHFIKVE